jgi:hypothetical protein
MFLEELLARFIPLEWMTKIPLLSGIIAFYLLYMGGECDLEFVSSREHPNQAKPELELDAALDSSSLDYRDFFYHDLHLSWFFCSTGHSHHL